MSSLLMTLFLAVTMRLFVFEIKFVKVRQWAMNKSRLWNIFLNCPFCTGFWVGLTMLLAIHHDYFIRYDSLGSFVFSTLYLFCLSVSVGSVSYLINNFFELFEEDDSFEA